jgi:thiaminase (transcriptional activator TenA)
MNMSQPQGHVSPGADSLTGALWAEIDATFAEILGHRFVTGLADGSLEEEAFRYYVVQDAHFLRGFARTLSVAAARAPEERDVTMFAEHAAGALEVERSLHESFFSDFGMSEADVAATGMAPTNLAYTSYLLAVAYGGSFPETVAAVLPCYWIYWEVGKHLLQLGSPNPLFQRWIDTYGGEEYAQTVRAALGLTDRIAPDLGRTEVERMKRHVTITSRYEWMFWDMALRRERWPLQDGLS